ncbi:MAG: DUF2848 family protein, partial [Beijerinckiaceae bacterium]
AETFGIALSKQLCPKPVSRDLWRLDEVLPRWDTLELRSHALVGGDRVLYQDGRLASLRPPADLIQRWTDGGALMPGTLMFGGTIAAIGGIRPASGFEMEIVDPTNGRHLTHRCDIQVLPVVS